MRTLSDLSLYSLFSHLLECLLLSFILSPYFFIPSSILVSFITHHILLFFLTSYSTSLHHFYSSLPLFFILHHPTLFYLTSLFHIFPCPYFISPLPLYSPTLSFIPPFPCLFHLAPFIQFLSILLSHITTSSPLLITCSPLSHIPPCIPLASLFHLTTFILLYPLYSTSPSLFSFSPSLHPMSPPALYPLSPALLYPTSPPLFYFSPSLYPIPPFPSIPNDLLSFTHHPPVSNSPLYSTSPLLLHLTPFIQFFSIPLSHVTTSSHHLLSFIPHHLPVSHLPLHSTSPLLFHFTPFIPPLYSVSLHPFIPCHPSPLFLITCSSLSCITPLYLTSPLYSTSPTLFHLTPSIAPHSLYSISLHPFIPCHPSPLLITCSPLCHITPVSHLPLYCTSFIPFLSIPLSPVTPPLYSSPALLYAIITPR